MTTKKEANHSVVAFHAVMYLRTNGVDMEKMF